MSRKKPLFLGLLLGLMAMAFVALPAMASAAPSLTSPAGTLVPGSEKAPTTITATSTNAKTEFPALGKTLTCEKVVVHGLVTKNTGTQVEVSMDGASDTATGCKLGTESVAVTPTLTTIALTAASKTAKFDFTAPGISEESTSTVTCNTANPSSSVHIAGPVTGTVPGTFSGDFTAVVGTAGAAVLFDC